MTGRHTPRNPQSLLDIPDNYCGLSSNYAKVSTLMVDTQQVVGKKITIVHARLKQEIADTV